MGKKSFFGEHKESIITTDLVGLMIVIKTQWLLLILYVRAVNGFEKMDSFSFC